MIVVANTGMFMLEERSKNEVDSEGWKEQMSVTAVGRFQSR
jgi:hypothetical protein